MASSPSTSKSMPIVQSKNPISQMTVLGHKKYKDVIVFASFDPQVKPMKVYLDTEDFYNGDSLISESQLMKLVPDAQTLDIETLRPLTISRGGIGDIKADKFIRLSVYMEGTRIAGPAIAHMIVDILVVPELGHAPVLGSDFLTINRFSPDFKHRSATIGVCDNISVPLKMITEEENPDSKTSGSKNARTEDKGEEGRESKREGKQADKRKKTQEHKTKPIRYITKYESAKHSFTKCTPH